MKIIAPAPDLMAECREHLEDRYVSLVTGSVNRYWRNYPSTKRSKRAARRLGDALRRVLHVYQGVKADLDIATSLGPIDEITEWLKCCNADEREPRPLARPANAQLDVARLAAGLLRRYGHKVTVTPKGRLNRLVGALLGNPNGDHTFICRQALQAFAKRGSR
jgi:hypothetical protein